jgi:ribose transport system ATP-binding protein
VTATTTAGFTASSISKRYGQTLALDEVTVSLVPGEVTALVGHNGAGKSTLLRMLAGAETPDRGGLLLDGAPLHFSAPADALAAGIACVYQELRMINQLTVAQNVFLGHETTRRGRLARAEMNSRTAELCREYGVDVPPTTRAGELPVAQRQIVEVIAALNRRVRYLLLDEPTTALEAHQIEHLLTTVKRVSRERQLGVLLVDHKLDEVFSVADRVIGLSNGRVVLSGPADTVSYRDVVQAIVGESASADGITPGRPRTELPAARRERAERPEAIMLSAEHVATDRLTDVTLHAEAGEILGLYGLVGSGRSRFLRTVYGSERLSAGSLTLGGAPHAPASPGDAIRSGIAFLSEERKADGFIPAMSARENVPLPVLRRFSRAGQLQRRRIAEAARSALSEVAVRGDIDQPITRLSGGNQQKVLFARAVLQHPRLLLLDEPTKGVDIGAKAEIHSLIRSMAANRGVTVILVSTEEEELIGLADTVCVFRDGSCDGTRHSRGSVTPADLRRLAWPSSAQAGSG